MAVFPPLEQGRLLRRYKRFLADIELANGEQMTIHCPNTGSMLNCMREGAAPRNILWLPLGDSITWGCNGPTIQDCHSDTGGYRVPLAMALTQHPLGPPTNVGFNVTTMGTLETGPPCVQTSSLGASSLA